MKIALFLHQPKCSVESGNGILQALQPYHSFKIFTRWPLDADFFDDVDMIAYREVSAMLIVLITCWHTTEIELETLLVEAEGI